MRHTICRARAPAKDPPKPPPPPKPPFRSQNPHAEDAKRRRENNGEQGDRQALLGGHWSRAEDAKNKWLAHAKAKAHALWKAKREEDAKTLLLQLEDA